MRPFGFNVIGHVSGEFGLGIACRNTIALIERLGFPVATIDVRGGGGEKGANKTYDRLEIASGQPLPYGATMYHMNPHELRVLLLHKPKWFDPEHGLNVAVPYWELPRIPAPWEEPLSGMDAILAPTRFIGDAVKAALPDAEVIPFPQAVELPEGIEPDRARWGLREDETVFLCTLHTGSGMSRKNPLAAIEAFREAFPDDERVRLIVKMTVANIVNPVVAREHGGWVEHLRAELTKDSRVLLLEQSLSYRDVLTLYASSDVLVSLHRSEGLGLHLMEAMALGKVVVATGWSGNMDFMTPENSVVVPYRLVPVSSTPQLPHVYSADYVGRDLEWAEADIDSAANSMRELYESQALRARLGERARQDMRARTAEYEEGVPLREVQARYERFAGEQPFDRPRAKTLRSLWHWSAYIFAKEVVKKAIRRG